MIGRIWICKNATKIISQAICREILKQKNMSDKKQIYFAGAIRGDRVEAENIIALIRYIQELGHEVLTEHIAEKNISDASMKAEDIEKRDILWLDSATHVIAEISGASTGTGREIEYARTKGQLGKTPAYIL